MNKKRSDKTTKYVEVKDEPRHIEIFQNSFIRMYSAIIPPGEETLYHRHSTDTIYIVIQGGAIGTQYVGKTRMNTMLLPGAFGFLTKIKWGIQNLLFGFVKMPSGFFFEMKHKESPSIHRAVASKKNKQELIMLGIEIL